MPTPGAFGLSFADALRHYLKTNNLKQSQLTHSIVAELADRHYLHHEAQTKARKKKGDASPEEIAIYEAYPRKEGRGAALLAIRQALGKTTPERLKEAVTKYGLCVARWPKSYRYTEGRDLCPMPTTWFNQGRYEDDPKHWLPAGMFGRPDDRSPEAMDSGRNAGHGPSLSEPSSWREAVKGHEDLYIFAGRDWDTINPHYKKLIVKLCQP